ncbi:MAG: hypothetical protein MJE68_19285, partial [Proteobacteria bacterium]|nr:hypothetical protein [Pseudomonadota bacterium]
KIDRNKMIPRIRRLITKIQKKRVHEKTRGRKVQGVGLKTFHLNRIKIQVAMFDMIQEKQL